jgi:aspartyl-tRNA(Asn)/glutamyl-tRNA(Gln) amidotransferase subunit C
MALSLDDVRRLASLARLRLSDEEQRLFAGQLSAVLDYARQLEELDLAGVEPMTHALASGEPPPLRPDEVLPGIAPDLALAGAAAREGSCFKVPRIIE